MYLRAKQTPWFNEKRPTINVKQAVKETLTVESYTSSDVRDAQRNAHAAAEMLAKLVQLLSDRNVLLESDVLALLPECEKVA